MLSPENERRGEKMEEQNSILSNTAACGSLLNSLEKWNMSPSDGNITELLRPQPHRRDGDESTDTFFGPETAHVDMHEDADPGKGNRCVTVPLAHLVWG